jgi:DNA-binding response OmpR family regulator
VRSWETPVREKTPRRILVVEDDRELAELLDFHLRNAGFAVETVREGRTAIEAALRLRRDLIVLDLSLPGSLDGLDVCRALRSRREYVPILMLTARDAEVDRVLGLELGADDYMTKPVALREVVARVRAIFRRVDLAALAHQPTGAPLEIEGLCIDRARRSVKLEGRAIELTPREFDLLTELARHPGTVFTRSQLLDRVWGLADGVYEHTVNTHINRLRAKLEADPAHPSWILTVWGVGYKLREPEARARPALPPHAASAGVTES